MLIPKAKKKKKKNPFQLQASQKPEVTHSETTERMECTHLN